MSTVIFLFWPGHMELAEHKIGAAAKSEHRFTETKGFSA